jgi:hypothetical protein
MGGGYVRLRFSLHGAGEDRAVEMRASDYLCAKSVLRRDTMHTSDKKEWGLMGTIYSHTPTTSSHRITLHGRMPNAELAKKSNQPQNAISYNYCGTLHYILIQSDLRT